MRAEDPAQAEDFKKQMTERFQKTVQVIIITVIMTIIITLTMTTTITMTLQALEEESSVKKRQLLAMHQQRVISR